MRAIYAIFNIGAVEWLPRSERWGGIGVGVPRCGTTCTTIEWRHSSKLGTSANIAADSYPGWSSSVAAIHELPTTLTQLANNPSCTNGVSCLQHTKYFNTQTEPPKWTNETVAASTPLLRNTVAAAKVSIHGRQKWTLEMRMTENEIWCILSRSLPLIRNVKLAILTLRK